MSNSNSRPRINVICEKCGIEFSAIRSRVLKGSNRFCSKSCSTSHFNTLRIGSKNPSWDGVERPVGFYKRKFQEKYPEKAEAHKLMGNAIRRGALIKKFTCEHCGETPKRIEGHHEDYSKPLEVVWLCKSCHIKADKARRERLGPLV